MLAPPQSVLEKQVAVDEALLATMSTEDGLAELKQLFESLDKNADGAVSSKEWGGAVAKNEELLRKFFGGSTMKEVGMQFKRLDVDGNGELTWDEFRSGTSTIDAALKIGNAMEDDSSRNELFEVFNSLDKDSNGRVSKEEWGTAMFKNQALLSKYFGGEVAASDPAQTVRAKKAADSAVFDAEEAAAALLAQTETVAEAAKAAEAAASLLKAAAEKKDACEKAVKAAQDKVNERVAELDTAKQPVNTPKKTPKKKKEAAEAAAAAAIEKAEEALEAARNAMPPLEQALTAAAAEFGSKQKDVDSAAEALSKAEQSKAEVQEVADSKTQAQEEAEKAYQTSLAADRKIVAEITRAFKRLDIDNDGFATWNEFVAGSAACTPSSGVALAFAAIDKNQDGELSRAEVVLALRTDPKVRKLMGLGQVVDGTRDVFEGVFQLLDVDNSKAITLPEMAMLLAPILDESQRKLFVDSDGKVSTELDA